MEFYKEYDYSSNEFHGIVFEAWKNATDSFGEYVFCWSIKIETKTEKREVNGSGIVDLVGTLFEIIYKDEQIDKNNRIFREIKTIEISIENPKDKNYEVPKTIRSDFKNKFGVDKKASEKNKEVC